MCNVKFEYYLWILILLNISNNSLSWVIRKCASRFEIQLESKINPFLLNTYIYVKKHNLIDWDKRTSWHFSFIVLHKFSTSKFVANECWPLVRQQLPCGRHSLVSSLEYSLLNDCFSKQILVAWPEIPQWIVSL
jgi:hypothetical protein